MSRPVQPPLPPMLAKLVRELPADGFFCLAGAALRRRWRNPRDRLRDRDFTERRRRLTELFAHAAPPLTVTPLTDDRAQAEEWLAGFQGGGVDGVIAKRHDLRYEPGARHR